jgi:hypothetical protein
MPTYCFSSASGDIVEEFFPMGKSPQAISIDGETYERDFLAERQGRPSRKGWPIECIASGVNANQAGELRYFFRKHGENVDVTRDGNPIYTSPSQRKRLLKLRGFHDRNSFS